MGIVSARLATAHMLCTSLADPPYIALRLCLSRKISRHPHFSRRCQQQPMRSGLLGAGVSMAH